MSLDLDTAVGPHPVRRAVLGVLAGIAAGALAALIVPRDPPVADGSGRLAVR